MLRIIKDRNSLFANLVLDTINDLADILEETYLRGKFKIERRVDTSDKWPSVRIYKESWRYYDIRFQFNIKHHQNYFGIVREKDDYPFLIESSIGDKADIIFLNLVDFDRDSWYLFWEMINGDFNDSRELIKLLPENRSKTVNEYADTLISFTSENEKRIDELVSFTESLDKIKG